jgi:hypothetical protein
VRSYRGIETRNIDQRPIRLALDEVDAYLRDVNRALALPTSMETPASVNETASFLVLATHAGLTSERQLVVNSPLTGVDNGAGNTFVLDLTMSDSIPLADAAAGLSGTGDVPARFDHVHPLNPGIVLGPGVGGSVTGRLAVFSNANGAIDDSPAIDASLVALSPATTVTGNVATYSDTLGNLADSGILATLLPTSPATTVLNSIPIWGDTLGNLSDPNLLILTTNLLRPINTNLFDLGRVANKFKRGFFGTSIELGTSFATSFSTRTSNPYIGQCEVNPSLVTQGGFFTSIDLNAALGESLATGGAANLRFNSVEVITIGLGDESGGTYNFGTAIYSISSPAYTADRVLTLDMADGSRTLRLTGNLTGNQDVSSTASPTFVTPSVTSLKLDDSGSTFFLELLNASTHTANRSLTYNTGDVNRTLTLTGNATLDQDVSTTGTSTFSRLTLTDAVNGLQLNSSSGGALKIAGLGSETLVRTLTISHGGTNRTITLTGNPTLADWFDQSVKAAASPTFVGLTLTGALSVQGNTTIGDTTTDTVRFNAGGNAAAPATNAIGVIADYFGTSATRVLTTPNRWQAIIADDGNTYKIPLYS